VEHVFGYGSLALLGGHMLSRTPAPAGYVTDLLGFERRWGVAMDNSRDLPGYKRYLLADGSRPRVHVAFLEVVARAGARVNGVCLPVTDEALAELDRRERNYVRRDVTDRLAHAVGRTWAYVGSEPGRRRLRRARAAGRLVVAEAYRDAVVAGFEALGAAELDAARGSLDTADMPVWALERMDFD
jgi:Gamma-glutamyl cyclotransferase, AIG2-like